MNAASRGITPFDRTAQKLTAVTALGLALFCFLSVIVAAREMRWPTICTGLLCAAAMLAYGIGVMRLCRRGRIISWLRYTGALLPMLFLTLLKASMLFGKLGYGGVLKDAMSFDAFFLLVVLSALYNDRRLTMISGLTAMGLNLALLGVGVFAFGIRPTGAVEAAVDPGQVRWVIELLRYGLFVLVAAALNVISGHLSALLESLGRSENEARAVLASVARIQPQLESVLVPLDETARRFAARASAQAGASRQIERSAQALLESVHQGADHASRTRAMTEQTRADATRGNERLADVRQGFQSALGRVEAVRSRLAGLSESIDQTDEINQALRDISESLRYLAINAALEAAKAGQRGEGFAVVAREVERLVLETREDLVRSRQVLGAIRAAVQTINLDAAEATGKLGESVAQLDAAGGLIDRIVEGFASTAGRVEAIAAASADQAQGLSEVSAALAELDQGAKQVDGASTTLLAFVDRLTAAHRELEALLARAPKDDEPSEVA